MFVGRPTARCNGSWMLFYYTFSNDHPSFKIVAEHWFDSCRTVYTRSKVCNEVRHGLEGYSDPQVMNCTINYFSAEFEKTWKKTCSVTISLLLAACSTFQNAAMTEVTTLYEHNWELSTMDDDGEKGMFSGNFHATVKLDFSGKRTGSYYRGCLL